MIRSDFVDRLADAIADARSEKWPTSAERLAAEVTRRNLATGIAAVIVQTDDRFNVERFLRACEVDLG